MGEGFLSKIKYRILIVSDTHGKNMNLVNVFKKSGPFDMMFHAGDLECEPEVLEDIAKCPCYFARGNCDYSPKLKPFQVIDLEDHKVFLTHGHRYHVGGGTANLEYAAIEQGCDIAIYGHTHVPYRSYNEGLYVVNPGSVSFPRQTGRKKTFMIMEIYRDGTVDFNLVEIK